MKAMEDFQASTEFLDEKVAVTSKAMEDCRVTEDFHNEKADFATADYNEGVKST